MANNTLLNEIYEICSRQVLLKTFPRRRMIGRLAMKAALVNFFLSSANQTHNSFGRHPLESGRLLSAYKISHSINEREFPQKFTMDPRESNQISLGDASVVAPLCKIIIIIIITILSIIKQSSSSSSDAVELYPIIIKIHERRLSEKQPESAEYLTQATLI